MRTRKALTAVVPYKAFAVPSDGKLDVKHDSKNTSASTDIATGLHLEPISSTAEPNINILESNAYSSLNLEFNKNPNTRTINKAYKQKRIIQNLNPQEIGIIVHSYQLLKEATIRQQYRKIIEKLQKDLNELPISSTTAGVSITRIKKIIALKKEEYKNNIAIVLKKNKKKVTFDYDLTIIKLTTIIQDITKGSYDVMASLSREKWYVVYSAHNTLKLPLDANDEKITEQYTKLIKSPEAKDPAFNSKLTWLIYNLAKALIQINLMNILFYENILKP